MSALPSLKPSLRSRLLTDTLCDMPPGPACPRDPLPLPAGALVPSAHHLLTFYSVGTSVMFTVHGVPSQPDISSLMVGTCPVPFRPQAPGTVLAQSRTRETPAELDGSPAEGQAVHHRQLCALARAGGILSFCSRSAFNGQYVPRCDYLGPL